MPTVDLCRECGAELQGHSPRGYCTRCCCMSARDIPEEEEAATPAATGVAPALNSPGNAQAANRSPLPPSG